MGAEEFLERDLSGSRFAECDLSRVRVRGSDVAGMDIDAPWLWEGGGLFVNGVDVTTYVEEELNRRFPGRSSWRATDPEGLRDAWRLAVAAWDEAIARTPEALVDERVDGEWSFAETMRHLVHGTDIWLSKGVLGWPEERFHPLGLGMGAFPETATPYAEVLAARADLVQQMTDFLAGVTPEQLAEERANPHDPSRTETVCHCLQVVMEESWEHLRFALRDLDTIRADR